MLIRHLAHGLLSRPAGTVPSARPATGAGGTARYCYSVWLRHLIMADRAGLPADPATVAELGPGESLGAGIAALLCGAERYFAFDVHPFADAARDLRILEEIAALLRARAPVPGGDEFPRLLPRLDDLRFPERLLPPARLNRSLAAERVGAIREDLASPARNGPDARVSFRTRWFSPDMVAPASVDMIFSHAVLEHVDSPADTYAAMARWLKPDGFLSHMIDFKSHGTADAWNGHWSYPDWIWRLIRGRRAYFLNRAPYSLHRGWLAAAGFRIRRDLRYARTDGLPARRLHPRYRALPAEDLVAAEVHLIAERTARD